MLRQSRKKNILKILRLEKGFQHHGTMYDTVHVWQLDYSFSKRTQTPFFGKTKPWSFKVKGTCRKKTNQKFSGFFTLLKDTPTSIWQHEIQSYCTQSTYFTNCAVKHAKNMRRTNLGFWCLYNPEISKNVHHHHFDFEVRESWNETTIMKHDLIFLFDFFL